MNVFKKGSRNKNFFMRGNYVENWNKFEFIELYILIELS